MRLTPLAQELKRQGISVMDLARATGLNPKYLYLIKDGRRKNISWYFVAKISSALRVRPEILFPYAR
jgi:DNA-binding Xre family transcriptional regulator